MSLWKKVKNILGPASDAVWWEDDPAFPPDPLSRPRLDVHQLQSIEDQQAALNAPPVGLPYMVTASSIRSVTLGPGQTMMVNVGGQPISNVVQVIGAGAGGGGGSGYYSTSSSFPVGIRQTTSTMMHSTPDVKPLYDPQWFRDYLAARDEAVMERLSGEG